MINDFKNETYTHNALMGTQLRISLQKRLVKNHIEINHCLQSFLERNRHNINTISDNVIEIETLLALY